MSQSRNSSWYSESLADYHAVEDSFARARADREQEARFLRGEITYRTWVDGIKRRAKQKARGASPASVTANKQQQKRRY